MTEEQQRVLERVEKLLRLAGRNTNEAEAASATAKAMELLAEYNLSIDSVDETGQGTGRRAQEALVGGFYEYERDLWSRVADLNFCLCWHQKTWVPRPPTNAVKAQMIQDPFRRSHILRGQFKVVGRVHNIAGTRSMAGYLLGRIEQLTRDRLSESWGPERLNTQLRTRWAVSYREGIAQRICEKLWDRRQEQLREEEAREREARQAGMGNASTETAVTLGSLRKTEREANMDFLYGEGWSAREAAERAARAAREAAAEAEYTAWARANPEEAARQEEERRKTERRRSTRSYRGRQEKARDWGAYRAGYEKGESVGLDVQAEGTRTAGALS